MGEPTVTYTTEVYLGDSREVLKKYPPRYFNLIMTSPPYADARDKHYDSVTPDEYASFILSFHDQLWRVLADDGSLVLNVKDKRLKPLYEAGAPLTQLSMEFNRTVHAIENRAAVRRLIRPSSTKWQNATVTWETHDLTPFHYESSKGGLRG